MLIELHIKTAKFCMQFGWSFLRQKNESEQRQALLAFSVELLIKSATANTRL